MNRFVQAAATIGLVSATLLVACQKKALSTEPTNLVKLAVNQSARLNSGVTVQIDSLSDSRCPIGATCFWAGMATLRAILTKDSDTRAVRLTLGADPGNATNKRPDSTGVVLAGTTYKVVLRDVTPYPKNGVVQQPEAVIEVAPR